MSNPSSIVNNNSPNSLSLWPYTPTVTSSPKAKLAAALVKTQLGMGDATKGAKNPFFKSNYADLNAIREAILPAANANGLVVLQPTVNVEGQDYIRTLVIHESGEEMFADTKVVVAKQNDPQAYGSAISYARRYGLQAFFNIGAVDDDGEKAMPTESRPATKAAAKAPPTTAAASPTTPAKAITGTTTLPAGAVQSTPVTNPGTESVVAATEAKKSSSSFRRQKAAAPVEAPAAETSAATEAVSSDDGWT